MSQRTECIELRRLKKNRSHQLILLMVGGLSLQACSSTDPCPEFENGSASEAMLITKAKSNMISDLMRDDVIENADEIKFFVDCCDVHHKIPDFFEILFEGTEHVYSVGITHHKYDVSGKIVIYSNDSYFDRCGDYVQDNTETSKKEPTYPSKMLQKFGRKINIQEFKN